VFFTGFKHIQENAVRQSKKHSFYETMTNTVLGTVIGFCLVYFVAPVIGVCSTVEQSLGINAMFIVASTLRGYGVRRLFNSVYVLKRLK